MRSAIHPKTQLKKRIDLNSDSLNALLPARGKLKLRQRIFPAIVAAPESLSTLSTVAPFNRPCGRKSVGNKVCQASRKDDDAVSVR
jgi:hypothetical protein